MDYEVRALGPGQVTTLLVKALDEADARRQVAARALKPLSVRRRAPGLSLSPNWRRVSFNLVLFSQELLTLLEAGLTVVEAIEALIGKERQPETHQVLSRLFQSLEEGKSFSRALESLPEIFPPLYVGIARAAERTSGLQAALGRYVDYQVRLDAVKSRILTASIYPVILLTVGTAVALFLLGYVVPRFAGVYQGSGQAMPWLSALLLDWGNLLSRHHQAFALGGLGAAAAGAVLFRHLWRWGGLQRGLQRIPLVAGHLQAFQLARLYLTLGMLLDGGLPIVQGLGLVGELVSPDLRLRLQAATQAIQQGEAISRALDRHGLATSVGMRLLQVGEQSGQMGEMMGRIARLHDSEVRRAIERFSRIFEPLLMVFIGVIVGGIVILLYLPIFDLAGSIQ